jgi:hypothetical protein
MDDVIAVEVRIAGDGRRYFLTWGRIQDRVDPGPVCDLVLRYSRSCSLGGTPVDARLCSTLREAADSPEAPYFYECFWRFASRPVPHDDSYESWRADIAQKMEAGQEICYCGHPA